MADIVFEQKQQIQVLIEWLENNSKSCADCGKDNDSFGLIDLRNKEEYINGHFPNSTNIPLEELEVRMFELPPRESFIGVIYSDNENKNNNDIDNNNDNNTNNHHNNNNNIKEIIEKLLSNYKIKFLISQNQIDNHNEDNNKNNSTSSLKSKQSETGNQSKMLWKACLYLNDSINIIESTLKQQQQQKQHENNNDDNNKFNCIDIACGSGRDCLFLANRKIWKVVGVDNDQTLLNKMMDATNRFNLNGNVLELNLELEPLTPKDNQEDNNNLQIKDQEEIQCLKLLPTLLEPLKNNNNNNNNNSSNSNDMIGYDLVHVARYLHRPLFPLLNELVKPGGFILYHTFMTPSMGKPRRPRFLLNPNELKERFNQFKVLHYKETHLDDGRPIQVLLAQKPIKI
ncbi:hypothetical protein ACTFIU_005111 [Dictyostelium citrinum]